MYRKPSVTKEKVRATVGTTKDFRTQLWVL